MENIELMSSTCSTSEKSIHQIHHISHKRQRETKVSVLIMIVLSFSLLCHYVTKHIPWKLVAPIIGDGSLCRRGETSRLPGGRSLEPNFELFEPTDSTRFCFISASFHFVSLSWHVFQLPHCPTAAPARCQGEGSRLSDGRQSSIALNNTHHWLITHC